MSCISVTSDDILGVYDNVSALGIELAGDMRWDNILAAPPLPLGIPSLKSPFTNQTHGWRAIDFERAQKTALTRKALQAEHSCWLDKIYSNISYWAPSPATLSEAAPETALSDENSTAVL